MSTEEGAKPTYAQVAASSPPQSEAGDNGDSHEDGVQKKENTAPLGGAAFSKQKSPEGDKSKEKGSSSISSTGSSEPEMINVEPPPSDNNNPGKEPKETEPAPIVDNVIEEFIPLKKTTMLTDENDSGLEVVDDESERKKRNLKRAALLAGAGIAIALGIAGTVCFLRRARAPPPPPHFSQRYF